MHTLEHYLASLHTGQWFGFKNLNGDDDNKTYANIIIHSSDAMPTEKECVDGIASLDTTYEMNLIRDKRNDLLKETDYLALADSTLTDNMKTYRQELRDVPASNTVYENVTWPPKPE